MYPGADSDSDGFPEHPECALKNRIVFKGTGVNGAANGSRTRVSALGRLHNSRYTIAAERDYFTRLFLKNPFAFYAKFASIFSLSTLRV